MSEPDVRVINASELHELQEDQRFLECLEAMGVDNWPGYDEAREMYNEETIELELNNDY